MTDELKTFWVVCRDARTLSATVRHMAEQAAKDEAERLTAKENAPFYVLRMELLCEPAARPVQWVVPVDARGGQEE